MTLQTRRERVEKLYSLRDRISAEIRSIEHEIEEEIQAMRRAKAAARFSNIRPHRARVAVCGTDGGYYRHRRTLGEPACDACKLAHRVAEAERGARRAEKEAG